MISLHSVRLPHTILGLNFTHWLEFKVILVHLTHIQEIN